MKHNQNKIFWNKHRRRQRSYICVECGETATYKLGNPCREAKCPNCGAYLVRVGSYRYHKWQKEQVKEAS